MIISQLSVFATVPRAASNLKVFSFAALRTIPWICWQPPSAALETSSNTSRGTFDSICSKSTFLDRANTASDNSAPPDELSW